MRLFLARHGQTDWNIEGKAQGHTDIPLNPTGRAQAAALGRGLASAGIERVLSSDLLRARETAETLGLPVEARPELRERAFGEWEGRNYLEMMAALEAKAESEGTDRLYARPQGGESFTDIWDRLEGVADELRAETRTTLVVMHGASKAVLLARLLDGNLQTARAFRFPNCGVTAFERRHDGTLVMVRYAERFDG